MPQDRNRMYSRLTKSRLVLGCYVSSEGIRAEPEKIEVICAWPVPQDPKQLRPWLGCETKPRSLSGFPSLREEFCGNDSPVVAASQGRRRVVTAF
ncbi:unnamed protein product [Phytophthora fragariaefolia]|uniref:Unnamed protein product n=1 Tax=Phytophthora fragariaefolia TaxID=1490495 RepID=A0A9W6TKC2_9STRA|nr:unnamed protein product [Phytophthora fragariaefolia]